MLLRNFLKKRGNKFLLSNNVKLALKLKLDGVYIRSFNKNFDHLPYSINPNFIILDLCLEESALKKEG